MEEKDNDYCDNLIRDNPELVDEAFKKGMLKLKDGKTVKIDEKTAKFLNNAMKQLNPGNRKKMETEAMKDKKSFDAIFCALEVAILYRAASESTHFQVSC